MSIHYTPPPADGSAANELWKFITPPGPDNIELDQAKGVTGIFAVNPTDGKVYFSLADFGGQPVSGGVYLSGNKAGFSAITALGLYAAALSFFDIVTGEEAVSLVDENFNVKVLASDGDDHLDSVATKTGESTIIGNMTDGKNIFIERRKDFFGIQIFHGVTEQLRFYLDENKFSVAKNANDLFAVGPTGKIYTNQAVAGAHAVPAGEIEIFSAATGLSVGFIPLFT